MKRIIGVAMIAMVLLYPLVEPAESPLLVPFRYLPVVISLSLLVIFGWSVMHPPSVAEKFARRQRYDLPDEVVVYCRRVTLAWTLFFLVNGMVALYLTVSDNAELWMIYNGFMAYLLMGILFFGELTYRYWRFRPYHGAPTDIIFRRIFPPHG